MTNIQLGRRNISLKSHPYIIAEIGVNHEGSFDRAKKLIDLAKEGGADAAKFQSYKADTLASKNSPAYWDLKKEPTKSQHELFKKYDSFSAEQYVELSRYCHSVGIEFLSTPFDDESIDFLEPLMPFYKIASADITNLPFLKKIAEKNKPVVLSTGASTLGEIDIALDALRENKCKDVALLHCILNYPTMDENAHLEMISSLKKTYPEYVIGYSDHTLPNESMTPLVAAYLLGAKIIEKHFTHDKTLPGNDHYHSMDMNDLKVFKSIVNQIDILKGGESIKKPIPTESISRLNARRSIVLKVDTKVGHVLKDSDLTYKRPGTGISPLHWNDVIGRKILTDLECDHVLQWPDLQIE
jgi:sialic acid synthase SpsE